MDHLPSDHPGLPVGMFHQLPEDESITVGRCVAVEQFINALARHGGDDYDYHLFCPPGQETAIQKQVKPAVTGIKIHDQRILSETDNGFQFAAWHDNQLDTYRPFMLRSHAGKPYPITILHHTLSYKELLYEKFLRLLLSRPHAYDSIICTSSCSQKTVSILLDHVAERFNAEYSIDLKYRGRCDIIPLGVDTDFFQPKDRMIARDALRIHANAFVMLWIGRFSAIDKADLLPLVQVLSLLVRDNPDRHLLLLCNGRQRPGENFKEAMLDFGRQLGIERHIRIVDESQDRIPLLYSATDIFVSPVDNIQESFGLSPIEAMSCGIPQVVSDWDGYRDSVVHGETGFLIPTYTGKCSNHLSDTAFLTDSPFDHLVLSQSIVVDMTALRESIQQLIDSVDLRKKMEDASRKRALDNYAWGKIIPQYKRLWWELSGIAKSVPERNETCQEFSLPDYGMAFQHYPTRFLNEETLVGLTSQGRQLVSGDMGLPLYCNQPWNHIDVGIIKRIIEGTARMDAAGKPLPIGNILQVITKNGNLSRERERVFRHILWLLKYGFLVET